MPTRLLTVSSLQGAYSGAPVPFIRLSGRWLEQSGFNPGESIRVEVEYGRLVITKLTPEGRPVESKLEPLEFEFMQQPAKKTTRKTDAHYD